MGMSIAMVTLASCTLAGSVAADDLFPRGVYWPQERLGWLAERAGLDRWEYADQLLGRLHDDHHCNFIWVVNAGTDDLKRLGSLAAKHDLGVAGTPEPILWWRQHRTPEFAVKCAEESAGRLADAEGYSAYVLIDEPRAWELSYLDAIRGELARIDPGRPTLMVTMRGDTPAAINRTGFPIITSDIYPFFFKGDPNGPNPAPVSRAYYRLCASAFGEQCEKAQKRLWMMPQAFMEAWGDWYYDEQMHVVAQPGAYLHWRMPTVGETRWQIWEGLGSGSKGVIFFVLFPPRNERAADSPPGEHRENPFPKIAETLNTAQPAALLNPDSSATPQLTAMGDEFAAIERLAPVLEALTNSPFPVVFTEPPLHARTLRDGAGNLYAVVVNDDTDQATSGAVSVLPGITAVRDLKAEVDLTIAPPDDNALGQSTVKLAAGGGTLLRLVAEPGRRPLAACVEDFSAPLVTGKIENGEVRVRRLPWGVGWDHEVVQSDDQVPAALTCSIAALTGDPKVHRPSGPIYIVYHGRGGGEGEGVALTFSQDGETFTPADVDEFGKPVPIPRSAAHVRFTIMGAAALSSFCVIATETSS